MKKIKAAKDDLPRWLAHSAKVTVSSLRLSQVVWNGWVWVKLLIDGTRIIIPRPCIGLGTKGSRRGIP